VWRCYGEGVAGDNAPELHDRFSIHPRSVEFCRDMLKTMARAAPLSLPNAEEEIDGLSDWEAVQHVERLRKRAIDRARAMQSVGRAAKAAAANLTVLTEQLIPLAGHELVEETELFLAIDQPV
jgi:hypothetical protein